MPTFGFSYFLKLLCSNERPRRTQIRVRLRPSDGGYDYHRSLRQRIQRILMRGEAFDDVIESTSQITNLSERNSARQGLERLQQWLLENSGSVSALQPATWESPDGEFRVRFEPDFAIWLDGRLTAVHVWNSLQPPLVDRFVYAALSLVPQAYLGGDETADDVAVLSLQTGRFYRLSEAADHSLLAGQLVSALDNLIAEVRDELEREGERPPGGLPGQIPR